MKKNTKHRFLLLCTFTLLANINLTFANTNTSEIETIFNWAESKYQDLFPGEPPTKIIDPWIFRYYSSTGIYVGAKEDNIFVFGGPWGTGAPTFIDTVPNLINEISTASNAISSCNIPPVTSASVFKDGVSYILNNKTLNVSTNGKCVDPDETDDTDEECNTLVEKTGISLLEINKFSRIEYTGVPSYKLDDPSVDYLAEANKTTCWINAPKEKVDLVINYNTCYRMSDTVTFTMIGTTTHKLVSDCFATGADIISDYFTNATWIKSVDGSYEED